MDAGLERRQFSLKFGIAGLIATVLAFGMLYMLLQHESLKTIASVGLVMFGAPFWLASIIALLTERPHLRSLRGMAIGLLVISVIITLYSALIMLMHTGGGANIGGLSVLIFSPLFYLVAGYLGWRS
ncbi:hypothetical protein [Alteromonas flava]|uniref:hypothetical protein n=1 Tax=Alteromonas flava TaxID=2048003 RepID=UPI000C283A39|nr:hypothetical protein [Alteromonas flava]